MSLSLSLSSSLPRHSVQIMTRNTFKKAALPFPLIWPLLLPIVFRLALWLLTVFQEHLAFSSFNYIIFSVLSSFDLLHTAAPITDALRVSMLDTHAAPDSPPKNADMCQVHLAADIEVSPMFRRRFIYFLPWISQLWVNKRATRLGQIGLMAGFCLPFAVIYSCVYSSCRYSLWSGVPSSFPAPPGCQRGNTVALHQVGYAPPLPLWYRTIGSESSDKSLIQALKIKYCSRVEFSFIDVTALVFCTRVKVSSKRSFHADRSRV